MANPMYGQNKFDNAIDNAKESVIVTVAARTLLASDFHPDNHKYSRPCNPIKY